MFNKRGTQDTTKFLLSFLESLCGGGDTNHDRIQYPDLSINASLTRGPTIKREAIYIISVTSVTSVTLYKYIHSFQYFSMAQLVTL